LKFFAENSGVDVAHVKTDGRLGQTLALEIGERRINVMLNDVGSNYDFAFDSLRDTDLELIENSQLVTVHDWGTNVVGGTDLAVKTFAYAKQYNVKTYFDSADPSSRVHDLTELHESVIANTNLDMLSLNQNELEKHTGEAALERAIAFKRRVVSRVDYHTPWYAASIDDIVTLFPAYDVELHRSTGAGDAWNAGNIFGELLGLAPALRLCLANAVAGYYVSSRRGVHPTIDDLVAFVKTEKLRPLPAEVTNVAK
jgi:sugar/nucleoside kinase (ribokinase family)